jgi:hypothetical protein
VFKAKTFATHDAITDLVRGSQIPFALSELLGGDPAWYRDRVTAGQIALRFPGDHCEKGTVEASRAHFEAVRKVTYDHCLLVTRVSSLLFNG